MSYRNFSTARTIPIPPAEAAKIIEAAEYGQLAVQALDFEFANQLFEHINHIASQIAADDESLCNSAQAAYQACVAGPQSGDFACYSLYAEYIACLYSQDSYLKSVTDNGKLAVANEDYDFAAKLFQGIVKYVSNQQNGGEEEEAANCEPQLAAYEACVLKYGTTYCYPLYEAWYECEYG